MAKFIDIITVHKTDEDGTITGALCGFQLENGLDVDGICGPMTKAALIAQ